MSDTGRRMFEELTLEDRKYLKLLIEGCSDVNEVAEEMGVTRHAINKRIQHVLDTTGFNSRLDLVLFIFNDEELVTLLKGTSPNAD